MSVQILLAMTLGLIGSGVGAIGEEIGWRGLYIGLIGNALSHHKLVGRARVHWHLRGFIDGFVVAGERCCPYK
jgi:membrane protease YdiL (CAAX protease family)